MNSVRVRISSLFYSVVSAIFIDSILIHRLWDCHRLPERSFFLRGRQLHVCARCTGIITGLILSILIVPLVMLQINFWPAFLGASIILAVDGLSQLFKWRQSNNLLRFATGAIFGLLVLPSLFQLVWRL